MTNLIGATQSNGPDKTGGDFLEVLRNLAHALSQPLTSLRGSAEVALMGELNECECRRVLALVLRESHRMAEALETLRDLLEMEGSCEVARPVSWTEVVEKFLQEAASGHKNCGSQLVSNVIDKVWVKAIPEQLDTATRRLIGGVIKAGRGKQVVRVGLLVRGETACLSVCAESLLPDAEPTSKKDRTHIASETWGAGVFDWWIVRRAIERQGGSLKTKDVSETCRCFKLSLPLAPSEVSGKARTT
jgi:signal transduction histidine kinase